MGRRWRILLVVSLALNVFVLGAVSTAWLAKRPWGPFARVPGRGASIGMPNPRQLRAALEERQRPVLDDALRAYGPGIRERLRSVAAARAGVAEAIRAEPFDRGRLDTALARLREEETAVALAAQGMVAHVVEQLDADGRARVAELLPARRGRR